MKIRGTTGVIALLIGAVVFTPTGLRAQTQTTGALAGRVTDPSGAVVTGATVTFQELGQGTTQTTTTNGAGDYRFDFVDPGAYAIRVKASGFSVASGQTTVLVGRITTLNFQLAIGTATQTVTVNAATAPLIETGNGNVASTITDTQIANIPNPGNDLTYLAQLAPGSIMNTAGGGVGNFSSYGVSAVSNLFTLNGMDDNDPFTNVNNSGATDQMLGQNEIQEVTVVSNGYNGQYGGLAGANVNYVTRSGTDSFHGRAMWYWNGRALNANNWFNNATDTPRSFVNANQYGADLGGPIVKDKLFYYFDAEGLYLVIPTSTPVYVPSPQFESAVQANIDSNFGGGSAISNFYSTMFALYKGAPGITRAKDSLFDHGCDGSEYFINQSGYNFGTYDPTSNPLGTGIPCALTFQSNVGNVTHDNLQVGRIDWNVTANDRFFVRIQHELGVQATSTDPISPLFNIQSTQPEYQGQAQEIHAFSSGAVNQFLISGQWYKAIFGNANEAATLAAFPTTLLFPSGQLSDVGGYDYGYPQGRNVTQFQVSDDFARTYGNHTLKLGVKFRRNWVTNADYSIFSNGLLLPYTLDGFFWGGMDFSNPVATVPGSPTPYYNLTEAVQSFPTALEQRFGLYTIGGYVEDDWRVRPDLSLTLAFRLDHPSNPVCFQDCFALAAAPFPQLSTDPNTAYNQLIRVNQRQMLPNLTAVEAQPRVGFAWQPQIWGLQNTVVRGGFGIFYDNYPAALLDGLSENPPNDPQFAVFSGTISPASDPNSLLAAAAASNAAFQSAFSAGGSLNSISSTVSGFSPPNLAVTVNHPTVMQYQKWSLEVDHEFGANTSLSLQYVGSHANHIYFQNSGINGCNVTAAPGDSTTSPPTPATPGFTDLPACNATTGVGVNPNFTAVDYAMANGTANYNGLTAAFTHRYKSGLLQANYTWSHALDDVSNSGVPALAFANMGFGATNSSVMYPEDPANPMKYNYASSDYDVRHSLTLNYVWGLPIRRFLTRGRGPETLLDGWTVSGTMFLRSGFPITPVDLATSVALEQGGYGSPTSPVQVFGTQVAPGGSSVNCKALFAGIPEPNRNDCLNPANFTSSGGTASGPGAAGTPGGFGNVTRNSFRGPGYWNTDFSIMKHTKITERVGFVFGAQFFNVFNHPNFDAPVMDVSNPRFGQIVRTVTTPTTVYGSVLGADASPRIIQLKTELDF